MKVSPGLKGSKANFFLYMWKENFLSHLIDVYKCDFAVRNRSETLELVLLYFPVF